MSVVTASDDLNPARSGRARYLCGAEAKHLKLFYRGVFIFLWGSLWVISAIFIAGWIWFYG